MLEMRTSRVPPPADTPPADDDLPVEPRELKIEVTAACNLACEFCYQGDALGQVEPHMPDDVVFPWIDWAVDNGLPAVRFTGGEPTLHPRLKVYCGYARLRQRFVILNTNGMAPPKQYQELLPLVDDLRISLPLLDARRLDELTGGQGVLERKLALIQQALAAGVWQVCVLTPLLPENKGHLECFAKLAQTSSRLRWLPLRYEPTPRVPRPWTRGDAQEFVVEMAGLMERYPEQVTGIFLAAPFCAVSPVELGARVFHGRVAGCGPFRSLNVNARGRLQACCCVREEWAEGMLVELQRRADVKAVCSRAILPEECQRCPYMSRCGGGCRKPEGMVLHGGRHIDYLASFVNE